MIDVTRRDNLLTFAEVAKMYGVTIQTVRVWSRKGLAYRKVGRTRYTTPQAIDEFSRMCGSSESEERSESDQSHREAMEQLRNYGICPKTKQSV